MFKETILTVKTCDLKVELNCDGCVKKIKKILCRIEGVCQTNVDRQQGKVTVIGLMDMDTVFKKLKKARMSAQLWDDGNSAVVSKHQELQLAGSDKGEQLKDAVGKELKDAVGKELKDVVGKGLPQGESSSGNGGCGARSSDGTNDAKMVNGTNEAKMVIPQLTPTPQQHLPTIQQQIEQRLMLKGEKLPPHPMGMPPAINGGGKQNGKKISGGTKALEQGNSNNDNKNDATMVLPQPTPTPQQHLPTIQQQIEQRLQMLKGEKLPPFPMGMPPLAINGGGKQSGKKISGGTNALVPENANNDNKNNMGKKLCQDARGSQVKNGGVIIGQPPQNSAPDSLNNPSQAKKDISIGVGTQMMHGSMVPQKRGMMRPNNNMISPTSFPVMSPYTQMDGYNMQPYGGGAAHGLGMQQVARNPMPKQPYMMVQPQQRQEMMMNDHYPHSQNAHYGPGCTGYQLMGYDNGHGHQQQQYPPPMPLPPQYDNIFSEENPNICSLM